MKRCQTNCFVLFTSTILWHLLIFSDQNLKIDFSEKDLDDLKKQANNANDALKMTMYGKGLICVPDLEVQLPEAWQSNSAYLVKEQSGKLARMSDVVVTAQVK